MPTEYPYDSDFPYVVSWGAYGAARFTNKDNAGSYAKRTAGRVIDTTPKPEFENGFYQYSLSGIYYHDNGRWFDVPNNYLETDCPPKSELVRLVKVGS